MQNVPIQFDMNNSITTKTKLSSYYTDIEPSKGGKPEPPAALMSEDLYLGKKTWMKLRSGLTILRIYFSHIEKLAPFSRFYPKHYSGKSFVSINQLLPILPESINTNPNPLF